MTSPLAPEFMALQSALAGEYSLERELGRGGMGIVYLARDVQLDRDVAIKVLPGHLVSRDDLRQRFLREARTAAGLSHPHIVPIHRVGEAGGFVFFVMSYIAGMTLGERLRTQGPLPPAEAMRMLREVAWALAYAHGRGVVHRDVKPDNILLEEGSGRALVTDFGIAQVSAASIVVTDPGKIMGTAHFMSPEQAASETVDGRSDLYALGVVGYLAVSGRLPFEAANVPALLLKQATENAPSLGRVAPGAPSALIAAVERCLRRSAPDRFASGEALADALVPPPEARGSLPPPLRAWLRSRNPALTAYAAWSGLFVMTATMQLLTTLTRSGRPNLTSLLVQGLLAAAPLLPMVGYYRSQAGRLFRAGYSLADLRTALEVARREREEEAVAFDADTHLSAGRQALRIGTYAAVAISLGTLSIMPIRLLAGDWRIAAYVASWVTSGILILACNANEIPLLPAAVRRFFKVGLRERLWRSRLGAAIARGLGAPATSRAVGPGCSAPPSRRWVSPPPISTRCCRRRAVRSSARCRRSSPRSKPAPARRARDSRSSTSSPREPAMTIRPSPTAVQRPSPSSLRAWRRSKASDWTCCACTRVARTSPRSRHCWMPPSTSVTTWRAWRRRNARRA